MPATDRLRPHKQTAPTTTRKQPGQGGEHHPISRGTTWPSYLPAEHRELVTQDENLDLVRGL